MTTELLTPEYYATVLKNKLIEEIAENYDIIAVQAYADNLWLKLADFEDWREQFEDSFQGRHESFKEFAEELADECMGARDTAYFDYDGFTRDLEHDYWTELDRETYDTLIFKNH